VLCSIIVLSLLGETINIMTIAGLALAVGILVDDATVAIESIDTYLELGEAVEEAVLNGAREIAILALLATQPNPRSFHDLIYRIFRQSDH
jgi:multidrug efflux pump subunit AcrB